MPPRKRRVAPSGADMHPRQKRPTAATYALGGPDIAPRVRGRPVTRRQVLPDVPASTAPNPDAIVSAADAIATAVMAQLEASGRLLPVPSVDSHEQLPDGELGHPDDDITFRPLASVSDDVMNVLGGDVPQQSPGYNVINRPLGGNLPIELKQRIWNGDFIPMHTFLKEHDLDDSQNQRVSLELTQIGTQQALTMAKSHSSKPISSYSQWVSAFSIYAAVMTERFPNLAPSLFKHISDIGDMERRFGGMAWRSYDESFRREKKAHLLEFGQIHWDLRFRCLEQPTQAGRPPFLNPNTRSPIIRGVPSRTGRYTTDQCFTFEKSGSCGKPACPYKHTCAKCSGAHQSRNCGRRPPITKGSRPNVQPHAPNVNQTGRARRLPAPL